MCWKEPKKLNPELASSLGKVIGIQIKHSFQEKELIIKNDL